MQVNQSNPVFNNFNSSKTNVDKEVHKDVSSPQKPQQPKQVIKQEVSGKVFTILGSLAGSVIPMLFMRGKGEKFLKSLTKIDYNPKNIIILGNSALLGGFLGGLADSKGKNLKEKSKEFMYNSLANMTLPTMMSAFLLNQTKNIKIKNPVANTLFKFGVNAVGFVGGLLAGREVLSVFDKNIKKERQIHPKDFLMMSDDIPTILALTKQKFMGLEHLVPLCAFTLGVETGAKK